MRGIDAADGAGLKIKINAVALRDVNEEEFDELIRFSHGRGFDLTLIETMPMGDIDGDRTDQYLPLSLVRARLSERWTLKDIPTARAGPPAMCESRKPAADLASSRRSRIISANLQPRARHLHWHALYVPRPRGCRRSACAAQGKRGRRFA